MKLIFSTKSSPEQKQYAYQIEVTSQNTMSLVLIITDILLNLAGIKFAKQYFLLKQLYLHVLGHGLCCNPDIYLFGF